MKANEVIKLAEMINTFRPKEDKMRRPRNRMPRHIHRMDDVDVLALMNKRLTEAENLKRFLEEREKINKKEEKKKDNNKDGLSLLEIAMLLVLMYPIIGAAAVALYFLK